MLKKLWHDPVWSKVISTAIIAAAGSAAYYFRLDWWPALKQGFAAAWAFLLSTSPVRHWVLGLLILVVAGTVVFVLAAILSAVVGTNQSHNRYGPIQLTQEEWRSYTTDSFFDIRWRWKYEGGSIERLLPFCPHCDYQLQPHNPNGFVSFYCDSCRRNLGTVPESWDSLESKVTRFIQQKLRTGSWPGKAPAAT